MVDLDASDRDEGLNRELVYFFVGGSQDLGPFHIDRENGCLYLVGQLDYETTTEYTVRGATAHNTQYTHLCVCPLSSWV